MLHGVITSDGFLRLHHSRESAVRDEYGVFVEGAGELATPRKAFAERTPLYPYVVLEHDAVIGAFKVADDAVGFAFYVTAATSTNIYIRREHDGRTIIVDRTQVIDPGLSFEYRGTLFDAIV